MVENELGLKRGGEADSCCSGGSGGGGRWK